MALRSIAKKLFRTLARVIPQCGMISQAVAFNMFLAFFPILLVALGLMNRSLRGKSGPELVVRLSAILPPGSVQLVNDFLVRREVNPWNWVLLGWVGTVLVGTQVMKLIMEGIHLIYGDRERSSFLIRQLRGLLLFCVSIVAWFLAVALSVFGRPLRQWMTRGLGQSPLARGFWTVVVPFLAMVLAMLVLALIYRVARTSVTTWSSVLPGAAVWTCLWRGSRGDRPDGVDGVLSDDRLFRCGLERGARCTARFLRIALVSRLGRAPPLVPRSSRETPAPTPTTGLPEEFVKCV
jgi:membrane protein